MVANEAPSIAQTGTLQNYNAAVDLIERNLAARPDKIAYIDEAGPLQFRRACGARESLRQRAHRARPSPWKPASWFALPTPSTFRPYFSAPSKPASCRSRSTPCSPATTYDFMLRDSRAQALIVSEPLLPTFKPILDGQPFLKTCRRIRRQ